MFTDLEATVRDEDRERRERAMDGSIALIFPLNPG